jgi:hypothetical protein
MQAALHCFHTFLRAALARHFGENHGDETTLSSPETAWIESLLPVRPTAEESIVFMLALAPHLSSQTLDLFFIQNKDLDRSYTEFGGWKGTSHNGFLPNNKNSMIYKIHLSTRKLKEFALLRCKFRRKSHCESAKR